jgi:diguanylate cyclase (GGDEF)-like protein
MARRARRFTMNTGKSAGWSVRVGVWLLALALVPLAGAAWFAANEVQHVDESSRQADAVGDATRELVQLTELRARVLDERSWTATVAGVVDIGFTPELVAALADVNLEQLKLDARAGVDELVVEVGWPELANAIESVRSMTPSSPDEISDEYEQIAAMVEDRSDRALDSLLTIAGDISNGAELVAALRVLESASIARQAVTLQLTSYFGAQFTGLDRASVELRALAVQRAEYQDAMSDVARIASPRTEALKALNSVEASEDVVAFRASLSNLLAAPPSVTDVGKIDVPGILAQLDTVAATWRSATASIHQHLVLVDAAGSDVLATSGSLDAAAATATGRALIRISVLAVASLLFAMGLARAIGSPLGQLAAGAEDLRDGDGLTALTPSGPTEVREAMHALNEAAAHIELVERQANALALGELEDPALSETSPGALGESLQDAVQILASSMSERKELSVRLAHEASHDSLTQLPNRKASLGSLQQGLARTKRTGATMAIMFLDLNGFKRVNDQEGHACGDAVLRCVSDRLVDAVRNGDHVGRLGGDEFLIIAEPITGAIEVVAFAQRLIDSISLPITVGSVSVHVGASIGIALADEETTLTSEELLRDADLAVYKAKRAGGSVIQLCDDALRAELDNRAEIETALRQAIELDELTLHYQPIVDPSTARLLSLEALVRWERPGFGLVPPDSFIPIAERSDLILAVDNWVVRNVVNRLDEWTDDDVLGEVPIAINVSGRHLDDDDFVTDILGPLARKGVSPERVVLEITESALLHDLDLAAVKLQLLRDVGIRIAIDDFGTGYTSLGHLRTLPVDILKIDRTFTADETASSLVKLIIDTGHLLGARVIAEGVETPEQASHLAEMGSDELQGYLYGHPLPPADLKNVGHPVELEPAADSPDV